MRCQVCNTVCEVERSVIGPTGFIEAMADRGHWHDRFACPNSGKAWHERALKLFKEIEQTHSKRVAALMRQDLDDLLDENGCQLPEDAS